MAVDQLMMTDKGATKYLMDDVKKWMAVYRLLDHVSTEVFDCGTLCDHACCMGRNPAFLPVSDFEQIDWEDTSSKETFFTHVSGFSSDNDLGIYLFPGEQQMLEIMDDTGWLQIETQDPKECGFPASWTEPVYFVKCKTPPKCPRNWRPLQCRTFPLKPVFGDSGVLELIWNDEELPYSCPLIEQNAPIHDDFYKATYTVWSHLVRDPRIFDLVMMW